MPPLRAFGIKLKVGSDDFVFPYIAAILMQCIWFAAIVYVLLDYDKEYKCDDEKLLRIYIVILMGIEAVLAFSNVIIVIISSRGCIDDDRPRRHLPFILYFQTAVLVIHFGWDCVGVVWAFDPSIDCSYSHKVLVLVRIVLIWNTAVSVIGASYLVVRVGICGLCCKRVNRNYRYELLHESTSLRRLSKRDSVSFAHNYFQRKWHWRLRHLCCCLSLKDRQRSIFSEVSATLSDAFKIFDGYVVSDIVAGMALVKMQQFAERKLEEENQDNRKPLKYSEKGVGNHINKSVRYLQFAMGAYGWMMLVYSRMVFGVLFLLRSVWYCCVNGRYKADDELEAKVDGDMFGLNRLAIMHWTGIQYSDIICGNFKSEVFSPAFYIALDHEYKAVVIVIRGTLSVMDALTDLSARPGLLMTRDSIKFFAHRGMLYTARELQLKLEGEGMLQKLFRHYPSYRLIITGHSLGAGVASLLAMLLKSQYPKLYCFAYAPPGGLINLQAVPHTRAFITSIILGNDLVPRLSIQNFQRFSERVLYQLKTNHLPKYRVFLLSFCFLAGVMRPKLQAKQEIIMELIKMRANTKYIEEEDEKLLLSIDSEEELFAGTDDSEDDREPSKHLINIDPEITAKTLLAQRYRSPLYLPGKIIHLTCSQQLPWYCRWMKGVSINARWAVHSDFSEMMIDRDMVSDHLPDALYNALIALQKQEGLI